MKTFTVATALLALSTSALAYQYEAYSSAGCSGTVLENAGTGIRISPLESKSLKEGTRSLKVNLGPGEENGIVVRTFWTDPNQVYNHFQYYEVKKGDHEWRCIDLDPTYHSHIVLRAYALGNSMSAFGQ